MRKAVSRLGLLALVGMMSAACAHTTDRTPAASTQAGSASVVPAGDPWTESNRLVADPTSGFWPASWTGGSGAASLGGPSGSRPSGQVLR